MPLRGRDDDREQDDGGRQQHCTPNDAAREEAAKFRVELSHRMSSSRPVNSRKTSSSVRDTGDNSDTYRPCDASARVIS